MERCTYIKIAGKEYPMSFSLGAAKKIISKYGSAQGMVRAIKSKNDDIAKLDMVTEIMELLIDQGCAYKNYFEKDMPKPENAPVINGKWEPLPKEALEIAIGVTDMEEMVKKIEECVNTGNKKEFETKEDSKNAKATQE